MTAPAHQLDHLFSPIPTTLAEAHGEMLKVLEVYRQRSDQPELLAQAQALFKANQAAKTDLKAAHKLLKAIKDLDRLSEPTPVANLQLLPGAQQGNESSLLTPTEAVLQADAEGSPGSGEETVEAATPDTKAAHVEAPETREEEPNTPDSWSEEPEEPNGEMPDEETENGAQATEAPISDSGEVSGAAAPQVIWPQEALGEGVFSALAQTLASGESVKLVMSRTKNEVLVTVYPDPISGETPQTALPLQFRGTPAGLDTGFRKHLDDFREGRLIAREEISYAAQVARYMLKIPSR